jgi:DNA repair exonuclease SbcCD nuclease subunit
MKLTFCNKKKLQNIMTVTLLFIGDPHFQINNLPDVDLFIEHITSLARERNPDIIVIAGDLLHTHERLHTIVLNKAHQFVDAMRLITKTYILVGNHDYTSNTQFLTDNHWMNAMKKWDNVVIVDTVITEVISNETFVFVPYVYPGRFREALDTLGGEETWMNSDCIFAHQEFEGCKMGAIISIDGDKWPIEYPDVVSGHIHSKQRPSPNIFYPGTPMQHAFGESETNIVAMFNFSNGKPYELEEIKLRLPRKKIVYLDVTEIDNYEKPTGDDKIRVTVSGNYEQFKALKKTKKYKQMVDDGIKVVFKPECKSFTGEQIKSSLDTTDFPDILNMLVMNQKNAFLLQAYDRVVNHKNTNTEDVFFL